MTHEGAAGPGPPSLLRRTLAAAANTVSDVMAWVNGLFGGAIPTLPLPPSWAASLTTLWSLPIAGDLPDPGSPKPWLIPVDGAWQPFSSCDATFEQITIVVSDGSEPPPGISSPPFTSTSLPTLRRQP